MISQLADKITLCDTKPGLAKAFAEELRHVTASQNLNVEIIACEKDEEVTDANIILISAGKPRTPGVKMTRRDLAIQNGKIIKQITELTTPNNRNAKYIVITNPVDAMAMLCKTYSKADFVISTGTNLESLRLRSGLANALQVPISTIEGWVGGEHGKDAIILWSTIKINKQPLEDFLSQNNIKLGKTEIDFYVKSVSRTIIDGIGGTEFGPAASFRDITRAIVKDTNELLPIAAPQKFEDIPDPVFVNIPRSLGSSIGETIYDDLTNTEKAGIKKAAQAIYQTYKTSI